MADDRSATNFGGKSKTHYSEPKGRIFDNAQSNLRDVVIVGKDNNGEPQIWSSMDQRQTEDFLRTAAPVLLEPAD